MASAPLRPVDATAVETRDGVLPTGAGWEALIAKNRPVLFRGAAADWPLVQAGLRSARVAADILVAAQSGDPVTVYRGGPEMGGALHIQ